jgi:hypothetical protein
MDRLAVVSPDVTATVRYRHISPTGERRSKMRRLRLFDKSALSLIFVLLYGQNTANELIPKGHARGSIA